MPYWAILNRLIVTAMGLPVTSASLGGGQTNLDNLLAIAVNLIVLVYFWRVLQQDWEIRTTTKTCRFPPAAPIISGWLLD